MGPEVQGLDAQLRHSFQVVERRQVSSGSSSGVELVHVDMVRIVRNSKRFCFFVGHQCYLEMFLDGLILLIHMSMYG